MNILARRKTDCTDHEWVTTVNSGLRRNICQLCGAITLEHVTQELSVSESLQKVAEAAR